ncbi:MAG: hypothetical protein AB1782_10705 [Cyanobacteriota bacterium]
MTLAISRNNPFVRPVDPVNYSAKKPAESVETTGTVASNPIKPVNEKKSYENTMNHFQAAGNYNIAMMNMQSNKGGMVGTETSGTVG